MTIKEALKAKSENLTVTDGKLDLVLIEASLNGAQTYDIILNAKKLDMVYVTLLLESITITEQSEDDVSINYSNNLKDIVSAIYTKWGLYNPYASAVAKVTQKIIW